MKLFATKHSKLLSVMGAIMLLYTVIGFLLIPVFVKKVAVQELKKALGRNVTIKHIHFNPYALSITVDGFQIDELKEGAFLSWETLSVNFELGSSLFHRTLVFKKGALLEPHVNVVRNADGTLNFADLLLLDWPKIPRFRLDHMRLADGKVVFRDAGLASPFSTTIRPLTGIFKNFSMSPDHKNSYSVTGISETGEKFAWNGFFQLNPLSSSGEIIAEDVHVKKYYPYLEEFLNFTIADGTLTARATYELDLSRDRLKALLHDGTLSARSLNVHEHESDAPLFALADFSVNGALVDLVQQKIEVASLAITDGSTYFRRLPDNSFNVQHVIKPVTHPVIKAATSSNWHVSVGEIHFRNGKLMFTDDSLTPPVRMTLSQLDFRIGEFSSENPRGASVAVNANFDGNAKLKISGKINPIHKKARINVRGLLQNVNLVPFSPYATKYLGYELTAGELSLDVQCLIHREKLHMQNKIEIEHLMVGQEKGDIEATDLPIQLAIALLKDPSGKITLNVPIEGSLDDPQFHLKKAMVEALLNPFRKDKLRGPMRNAMR